MKPFIISFLSIFSLNVLEIYKELQPLLFDILQLIIAGLTIYYLIMKIRRFRQLNSIRNENKRKTKNGTK